MSLLYECINTVIAVLISISSGLPNHNASIQLCVQKLRILIEDSDQNLKYLGLLAMSKILKTHPKSVQAHKDLVLSCLDDKDESIRLRALDLLYGMVTKKNLMEIVQRLVKNVTEGQIGNKFRDELILKLVDICSQNDYQYIVNFEWYLSVLIELARVEGGTIHGTLIAQQILDVAIRVDAIRQFATEQMSILLENSSLFLNNSSVSEVLYAAAWICGEFADYLPDQESTIYNLLSIFSFPPHITAVFIQNASKILSKIASNPETDDRQFITLCSEIEEMLLPYLKSQNLEIQERATSLSQIISIFKSVKSESLDKKNNILLDGDNLNGDDDLQTEAIVPQDESNKEAINFEAYFYAYPLNPVAAKAQRKVPVPAGLELDIAFLEEDSDDEEAEETVDDQGIHLVDEEDASSELDEDEEKRRSDANESRRFEQENNPHYLKSKKSSKKSTGKKAKKIANVVDSVEEFTENVEEATEVLTEYPATSNTSNKKQTSIPGLVSSDRFLLNMKQSIATNKKSKVKPTKGKKKKSKEIEPEEEEEEESPKVTIRALEMPEGADLNENDDDDDYLNSAKFDPHRALAKVSLEDILEEPRNNHKVLKQPKKTTKKTKSKSDAQPDGEVKGKKKKTSSKATKTVNDLITGETVVEANNIKLKKSTAKPVEESEAPIKTKKKDVKVKPEDSEKKSTKKTTKKSKSKNSKNRAEYEETIGIEANNLQSVSS